MGGASRRGGSRLALLVALVWTGHVGADRLFGCGRKFESGFRDTHFSTQPAPVSALREPER
jgi:hypothetical protein